PLLAHGRGSNERLVSLLPARALKAPLQGLKVVVDVLKGNPEVPADPPKSPVPDDEALRARRKERECPTLRILAPDPLDCQETLENGAKLETAGIGSRSFKEKLGGIDHLKVLTKRQQQSER